MNRRRTLVQLSVAAALIGVSAGAQGSGFALIEQNASGIGNAYAGAGAAAEDASTIFFNPAGMTLLPGKQFATAVHGIKPSAKFTNTGSTNAALQPSLGGNGGDAGDWALVPNAYFSWQLSPKWYVGVGLNAPFGLKTEYDSGWVGRFHALESEVKTINVNPSVAYKLSDTVALGAGINWQRAEATLSNAVNYSGAAFLAGGAPLLGAIGGAGQEGVATIKGDDSAWGYNLGAMFTLNPNTRIGIAYRSAISYTLTGNVGFTNRPALLAAAVPDGAVGAAIKLPGSASWSIFHRFSPRLDGLADISWTDWSTVKTLNVVRSNGALLATTPLNWKDTWRVSAGANYHYNSAWTARAGIAYDQAPVPDADRTPRVPDQDRFWLALGAKYRLSKQAAMDFGYAHLFVREASVNLCNAAQVAANPPACSGKNNLVGTFKNNVNIISAQFTYGF